MEQELKGDVVVLSPVYHHQGAKTFNIIQYCISLYRITMSGYLLCILVYCTMFGMDRTVVQEKDLVVL